MAKVSFKHKHISIEVEKGTTLAECIRRAKLYFETPCNCIGICGKCRVKAFGELYPITTEEARYVQDEAENYRVACLAKVRGDVEIELLEGSKGLKTFDRGYALDMEIDSCIKEALLPGLRQKESAAYSEYIPYHFTSAYIYTQIGSLEKDGAAESFGIVMGDCLLDISREEKELLGIAFDIGTTGISAYLIKLKTGEIISKASALNPQTQYGGDVLSRISFCMNEQKGTQVLQKSIVEGMNVLVERLLSSGWKAENVYHMVVAANTTMLHLLLGVHPASIAKAPYRPVFLDKIDVNPTELGIHMNSKGVVTLLPSASAYVGADILAGVAAVAFDKKKHPAIFIDIGTNGELVLVKDGKIAATSTAAGPALEGMNISCGSRAEEGAIDRFTLEDFDIRYTTIGNKPPQGICGSGLIDIAAGLVAKDVVLQSGRFNVNLNEKLKSRLIDKRFYITEDIFISQKDIRQIQLAKGAIAAGISMLLKEMDSHIGEIHEIVIAGAFGYHINPESILRIGLVPKGYEGKITFVGNSSLEGARLALTNRTFCSKIAELKDKIHVVELSTRVDFQQYFVKELNF